MFACADLGAFHIASNLDLSPIPLPTPLKRWLSIIQFLNILKTNYLNRILLLSTDHCWHKWMKKTLLWVGLQCLGSVTVGSLGSPRSCPRRHATTGDGDSTHTLSLSFSQCLRVSLSRSNWKLTTCARGFTGWDLGGTSDIGLNGLRGPFTRCRAAGFAIITYFSDRK